MSDEVRKAKAELRERFRTELKKISPEKRAEESGQLRLKLEEQDVWRKAKSILFYAPLADEPDVWQLMVDALAAGKTAALPRFVAERDHYVACQIRDISTDLQTGRFGIREPTGGCTALELNALDLALVPGLGFDGSGHRLGRGKGFYDRLLAALPGPTCGVAFDEQITDAIPVEPHDVLLSFIVTPTRWHAVASPRAVLK